MCIRQKRENNENTIQATISSYFPHWMRPNKFAILARYLHGFSYVLLMAPWLCDPWCLRRAKPYIINRRRRTSDTSCAFRCNQMCCKHVERPSNEQVKIDGVGGSQFHICVRENATKQLKMNQRMAVVLLRLLQSESIICSSTSFRKIVSIFNKLDYFRDGT